MRFHGFSKNYEIVCNHCHYIGTYRAAAHSIRNLRYKTPKYISMVFRYGSNYGYHFIIKQLSEKFEGLLKCLGETTEKYITLSVLVNYKMRFIDSVRFIASSFSSLLIEIFVEGR